MCVIRCIKARTTKLQVSQPESQIKFHLPPSPPPPGPAPTLTCLPLPPNRGPTSQAPPAKRKCSRGLVCWSRCGSTTSSSSPPCLSCRPRPRTVPLRSGLLPRTAPYYLEVWRVRPFGDLGLCCQHNVWMCVKGSVMLDVVEAHATALN